MQLPLKPRPTEKYLTLGGRQASMIAWQVAKQYSPDGKPDWGIFRDWTQAHLEYTQKMTAKN